MRWCAASAIVGADGTFEAALVVDTQHLRQIADGTQPVRARPVVPLPKPLQFHLQPQEFNLEIVGPLRLLFGPLSLAVAIQQQRTQQRLQCVAVLG